MVADTNTGVNFLNTLTGLIGKAVDVAPDIYALKNGFNKKLGFIDALLKN